MTADFANMNRELGKVLNDFMFESDLEDRKPMLYRLKPGQHMYLRWRHKRTEYCYTPHPDTNGDYWCFNRVITFENPNAKIGELCENSEMRKAVRCAKRSVAKRKAWKRYCKAKGAVV